MVVDVRQHRHRRPGVQPQPARCLPLCLSARLSASRLCLLSCVCARSAAVSSQAWWIVPRDFEWEFGGIYIHKCVVLPACHLPPATCLVCWKARQRDCSSARAAGAPSPRCAGCPRSPSASPCWSPHQAGSVLVCVLVTPAVCCWRAARWLAGTIIMLRSYAFAESPRFLLSQGDSEG